MLKILIGLICFYCHAANAAENETIEFMVEYDKYGNSIFEDVSFKDVSSGSGEKKKLGLISTNRKEEVCLFSDEKIYKDSELPYPKEDIEIIEDRHYFGLSIDGGGIRGLMPAIWLEILEKKIQKRHGKDLVDLFDCIGGTSVGGMLALGLSLPLKTSDLVNIFKEQRERERVFPPKTSKGWFIPESLRNLGSNARNLLGYRHESGPLEGLLKERFSEDTKLRDLKTDIFVTSCDTDGHPFAFINTDPYLELPVWEVARCTSAAPTYFEAHEIMIGGSIGQKKLVDGGVWANNPSPFVVGSLIKKHRANPSQIHLLSLGTGEVFNNPIPRSAGKLAVGSILEALMSSHSRGNDIAMQYFLGKENYCRINHCLDNPIELDNVSHPAIAELEHVASLEKKAVKDFYLNNKNLIEQRFEIKKEKSED